MDKERFSVLLRPSEREALQALAETIDRSAGATVRLLIRQEAKRVGVWPVLQPGPALVKEVEHARAT